MQDTPTGRPLAVDSQAKSESATEPAFIARPEAAPVYHGFVLHRANYDSDQIADECVKMQKVTHPTQSTASAPARCSL
jgi:hypothetical protein